MSQFLLCISNICIVSFSVQIWILKWKTNFKIIVTFVCISRKPENVQKLQFESVLKSETDLYAKNPQKSSIYTFRSLQRVHFDSFDNFAYNTPLLQRKFAHFHFSPSRSNWNKIFTFLQNENNMINKFFKLRSLCFQNWFCKHFYSRFLICNITIYIWKLFFFFF